MRSEHNMNINNRKISFIIPTFNCADTIKESIESIINGNFKEGDEIIIINDASTDNTEKILAELKLKFPVIIILKHNYNKGSAAAGRNTGIDYSKNEYIFCLDADNILAPNSVQELKSFMIKNEADIAAFGEMHFFQKDINKITQKWIFKDDISLSDAINDKKFPGSSGNYLFTKDSWLRASRYNESVGGAYDSWAFGIQQLATGSKMVTMPKTFYFHRTGYDSTFMRDGNKRNSSLLALQILLPFLDLIESDDIDYVMSHEKKYSWFDDIENHSIKLKGININKNNKTVSIKNTTKIRKIDIIKIDIINLIKYVKNIINN